MTLLHIDAATSDYTCPSCPKVIYFEKHAELKVHIIDELSPLGQFLAAEMKRCCASQAHQRPPKQIPVALAQKIPDSFNLASSSAVIEGLNLPEMLPAQLCVPEHKTLQSLGADVFDALCRIQQPMSSEATPSQRLQKLAAAAWHAVSGSSRNRTGNPTQPSKRVVRWVIKRCIRAAFEVVQADAQCYTRDLYWCCKTVQQHLPKTVTTLKHQHSPAMWAAVQVSLMSLDSSTTHTSPQPVAPIHQHDEEGDVQDVSLWLAAKLWYLLDCYMAMDELHEQDVVSAIRAALRTVAVLDVLALARMTTVPDRWRPSSGSLVSKQLVETKPRQRLPPETLTDILQRASTGTGVPVRHAGGLSTTRVAVAQELASQGLLQSNLVCAAASELAVAQPVREFKWDIPCDQEAAIAHLKALQNDVVTAATFEPLVIRGGARSWQAVQHWNIDKMVTRGADLRGTVRISPSPEFPFVMSQHASALAAVAGPDSPPTVTRPVRSSILAFDVLRLLALNVALSEIGTPICRWALPSGRYAASRITGLPSTVTL